MIRRVIIALLFAACFANAQDWHTLGALWTEPSSTAYTPTAFTNLLLRWSFNSGNGTNVPDESGNGNYAYSLTGEGPTVLNGYASFTGTNYMRTVATNLLYNSTGYTMTFWIWVDSFTSYAFPFSATTPMKYLGFEFDTTASKKMYAIPLTYSEILSSEPFSTGKWVFVASTWKTNSTKQIIIDSTFTTGSYGPIGVDVLAPIAVGNTPPGGYPTYRGFNGRIDECRVYNRQMTSNEIVQIRDEGRP